LVVRTVLETHSINFSPTDETQRTILELKFLQSRAQK